MLTTKILMHSFVCSKIDSCKASLYGLPNHMIFKLQNVENAAACMIAGLSRYDHITPVLLELHWLPVEHRIIFKINLCTFKCLHNLAPPYLQELLELYKPARTSYSSIDVFRLMRVPFNL